MSKLASGQWSCAIRSNLKYPQNTGFECGPVTDFGIMIAIYCYYVGGRKSDDERLLMLFAAYLPVRKQIRRCQSHQTINDIDCYSQQADFKMLWTWTLDYIKLNYYTPNCPSYNDSKHIKQINIKSICPIPIPIQKSIHSSQQADFGLSPHLNKHTADYLTDHEALAVDRIRPPLVGLCAQCCHWAIGIPFLACLQTSYTECIHVLVSCIWNNQNDQSHLANQVSVHGPAALVLLLQDVGLPQQGAAWLLNCGQARHLGPRLTQHWKLIQITLRLSRGIWINFKFHNYLDLQKFHMFCTCTFGPFWPFPAKTERYKAKLNRVFPNQCQYTAELGLKVSYYLSLFYHSITQVAMIDAL